MYYVSVIATLIDKFDKQLNSGAADSEPRHSATDSLLLAEHGARNQHGSLAAVWLIR